MASFSGGPFDVRSVVAGILSESREGVDLDAVPWGNFPHGHDAREAIRLLHKDGEAGEGATGVLWGLCANDSPAAAALAMPFLIPVATDADHPHRAAALAALSGPARAGHQGIASREELLLHRNDPRHDAPDSHDGYGYGYGYEVTGYPAGWSVAAARTVITTATNVLLPLLKDCDSTVRVDAAYVLATAADPVHIVRTSLANQFAADEDSMVRAALLLAIAEITRAHPHPPTVTWLRERWHDRTQAPDARLAAAIGWLCLTDDPAPAELRQTVDALADDERAHAMEALPWMNAASGTNEPGLLRCRRCMLHPADPDPEAAFWDSLF
ncbi:HEAT repeat domain-containing protein [Streptomyces sp. NPDC059271]|uniref:HEAT repeat domain-containing protein n=1 Tax=Streptomyces sp. NPDC059271 TaxID=3346799 RepID=UPI003694DEA6